MPIRHYFIVIAVYASAMLISGSIAAEQAERPKIGLALAGGGAKGSAHLAVLEFLEANRIPVDYIAGTSIGAYVGGMYALGYKADDIRQIMFSSDLSSGYSDAIPREDLFYRNKQIADAFNVPLDVGYRDGSLRFPNGLLAGQSVSELYRLSIGNVSNFKSFDDMPIPYRAVATDLISGDEVVIDHGNLVIAMQASATVPGALMPEVINGKVLVDGGLSNNMPIKLVREMGADIVIAVDISAPLMGQKELSNSVSVVKQISAFLTNESIEKQKEGLLGGDIYLRPDIEGVSTTNFHQMKRGLEAGDQEVELKSEQLLALSLSDQQYSEYQEKKRKKADRVGADLARPIARIILENNSTISDVYLLEILGLQVGEVVDEKQLVEAMHRVYALDYFERVNSWFELNGEEKILVVQAKEKSWGPNYIQAGLGWEDDFSLESIIDLDLAYTVGGINDNGGEWRNEVSFGTHKRLHTELYLPIDDGQRFYSRNFLEYRSFDWSLFVDNKKAFDFQQHFVGLGLGLGMKFATAGIAELGIAAEEGEIVNDLVLQQDVEYIHRGGYFLLGYDTLNSISFPTRGYRFTLTFNRILEDVDGLVDDRGITIKDEKFYSSQMLADWKSAVDIGNHAVVVKASYGTMHSEKEGSLQFVNLGGFLNLSGFHRGALVGNKKVFAALIYQYDLGRSALGMESWPLYVGISAETGGVWLDGESMNESDLIHAGSLYVGTDTSMGPIALGYGFNDERQKTFYFYLGKNF